VFDWFRKKPVVETTTQIATTLSTKASAALPEYVKDYVSGSGKPSTETYFNTYKTSDLVNSCVNYIAETGALTKLRIGQVDKDGKIQPIKDKKVKALFDTAPNQFYTWQEMLEIMIQSYLLTGNSYINIELLKTYELWNLESHRMQVVPDTKNYIEGYLYNEKVSFNPEEVMHIRRANANNQYYGTSSVMECLADPLLLESYSMQDLKSFYENSSVGGGVLTSEFPLSQTQIDSIRTQFAENYGKGTKRHSMMLLPNKMTYQSVKLSPKDSMLLDSLKISDDRVLRVFRLNKVLLGGSEVTFGTKPDEVAKLVFNTAIRPIVTKIANQMQLFFQTLLGKLDIVVWCDFDDIPYMSTQLENKSEHVAKLWSAGIMSANEARDALGLSNVSNVNFDLHFMPSYLLGTLPTSLESWVPGTDLSPTNQQPPEPTTTDPQGGNNSTDSTRV